MWFGNGDICDKTLTLKIMNKRKTIAGCHDQYMWMIMTLDIRSLISLISNLI